MSMKVFLIFLTLYLPFSTEIFAQKSIQLESLNIKNAVEYNYDRIGEIICIEVDKVEKCIALKSIIEKQWPGTKKIGRFHRISVGHSTLDIKNYIEFVRAYHIHDSGENYLLVIFAQYNHEEIVEFPECHGCSPKVSILQFSWNKTGWEKVSSGENIEIGGSWGKTNIAELGNVVVYRQAPRKWLLVTYGEFSGQGYLETGVTILANFKPEHPYITKFIELGGFVISTDGCNANEENAFERIIASSAYAVNGKYPLMVEEIAVKDCKGKAKDLFVTKRFHYDSSTGGYKRFEP